MTLLYQENDYLLEQERVVLYLKQRALAKDYPFEYMQEVIMLCRDMYSASQITHFESFKTHEHEINLANDFASVCHRGQYRQFIDLPYIVHPREVATRAGLYLGYHSVMAALLHDVVEDCGVRLDTVREIFGSDVAQKVYYLTDPAKKTDGNRAVRLAINFEHFKESDYETQNVKLCDLLSNSRSIALCSPSFAEVYVPELAQMDEYFLTQSHLQPELVKALHQVRMLSEKIVALQASYQIIKLDKKKSKNLTSI